MDDPSAKTIFQFLRGALRGTFGQESLQNKIILFRGMNSLAQEVLNCLCFSGALIYFQPDGLQSYGKAYFICSSVSPWLGETPDIVLDFRAAEISIKEKVFSFSLIGENPYVQGIHQFYL